MVATLDVPQGVRLVPRNTFEVCEGMSIQAAINAAAAQVPAPSATNPWTIFIYPGIYNEAITMSSWVNLRGIGPRGSVVVYQVDVNGVIVLADIVEVQNLTVRLGTPTAARSVIWDGGVACTAVMEDLILEITTPGATACILFNSSAASDFTVRRCFSNIGGTGTTSTFNNVTNPSTFRIIDCDFTFTNANARHIWSTQAGTWVCAGNRWGGTCAMFNVTAGTFTFDNDAMPCTAAWTNTGSTMALRNCAIEAPVVAGNLATVRLKNCSYRTIQRAGTGNIVDESPYLSDAPWHVQKWTWQAVLAQNQVSVRGTPQDAGSGQVLLEVTDNVADAEAVETFGEIAGALGNEFTPARTPRFLKQISVDSFDAHVTMFFGLRETLGNAVPAATEDHAGFIWDGTNFKASSDDGVATQETNLTTPSTGAQHQLEVIVFGGVTTVGWVEFYVDGILVATHGTRIPVNGLDRQCLLATAGGGAGDVIQATVRPGGCQECPA